MSDKLRRSKRKITTQIGSELKRVKPNWMDDFWTDFDAEQGDGHNDGEETCVAKLYYYTPANKQKLIVGATGEGAGHAEMHALDQFIRNVCDNKSTNLAAYQDRGLEIECTAKACCLRCSIILGALKFSAAPETATYKSAKPMGKTQWTLNPSTRTFLGLAVDISEEMIGEIGRTTKL